MATATGRIEAKGLERSSGEVAGLLRALANDRRMLILCRLVEEGEDVMSDGKEKDDVPADLALIGAAQRVEHYDIAAYTTARNLALQLRQPYIVQLLTTSLGEEQNAGQLLDQIAQPLMSVARMPASVE